MRISLWNLVCPCCIVYVTDLLSKLALENATVSMDGITFVTLPTPVQLKELEAGLQIVGLEIVPKRRNILVENMKVILKDFQNEADDARKLKLSAYMTARMRYNYSYLSNLFSMTEGTTFRKYCISMRMERVKQLLVMERMDLLDIACKLNFSSPSHLASQFKKVTGVTTTEYKRRFAPADLVPELVA